ncbi:GAF domain-containing protein [Pseudarthrobacter sp. NPDC058329]|uniref:GAF domain-containing sensor histidine kinase n=1 Tax=Pseudarthrobacter sp. NPDC058329 TaxID=3346448 RepID=UPI0036D957CD
MSTEPWRSPMNERVEDLLRDFVVRADELLHTQEQINGLLGAVVALAEDLSLEAVLDRLVRSACSLVRAKYGALGVIGEDRSLSHFITVGIDEDGTRSIGDLPTGHGVLGLLIREPKPLRLHDLGQHPIASGFPRNHPPMKSFLGVPVRVRDVVFGNLYLTEKDGGHDFTAEDEDLAVALAAAAGVAIQNARLFEDSKRRQKWLEAGMELSSRLIIAPQPGDLDNLGLVAGTALELSDSVMAVVAVPNGNGLLRCRASLGVQGLQSGQELMVSAAVSAGLETGKSFVAKDPRQVFDDEVAEKLGSVLVCAMGHGSNNGVLLLARPQGSPVYSQSEVESSSLFGSRIGLALDLARVHELHEQNLLFTDRERIARDLHDLVIQRLFAAGLGVQSLRRFTLDPVAHERIAAVTSELDDTIRKLRDTIYSLRTGEDEQEPLTSRLLRVVQETSRSYAVAPKVNIAGQMDGAVPENVAGHLLSALSEGLSNAMRHSKADDVRVTVTAGAEQVELLITDNGQGFDEPPLVSGLANMRHRAKVLGGTCSIQSAPGKGTRVEWSASYQ